MGSLEREENVIVQAIGESAHGAVCQVPLHDPELTLEQRSVVVPVDSENYPEVPVCPRPAVATINNRGVGIWCCSSHLAMATTRERYEQVMSESREVTRRVEDRRRKA